MGLVNQIGILSKLCVSIFVFVSGYGLMATYKPEQRLGKFYLHRFKKLYLNYWFIWLVFVPIGVFVFHRTFADVYGNHMAIKAVLEFFGLLNLAGLLGYNPTWWFYSCIIPLYLLFPAIRKAYLKYPVFMLTFGLLSTYISIIGFCKPFAGFVLPFLEGMFLAHQGLDKFKNVPRLELVVTVIMLAVVHNFCNELQVLVNTLLCINLALLLTKIQWPRYIRLVFESLGKHSMNIFLFHTFIFYYWFRDYIYITRNPLIIFLELLIVCYLISVVLEWVKKYTVYKIKV